jgi:hypothetical protein
MLGNSLEEEPKIKSRVELDKVESVFARNDLPTFSLEKLLLLTVRTQVKENWCVSKFGV